MTKFVKTFFLLLCGAARHEEKKTENITAFQGRNILTILLALLIVALPLSASADALTMYTEQNLFSDIVNPFRGALGVVDPNLKNLWGVMRSTASQSEASGSLVNRARLYGGYFNLAPDSITPLVVSVLRSSTGTTLTDFVVANGAASGSAISISSKLNSTTAGQNPNTLPEPQDQGLFNSIQTAGVSVPQAHSILLILSGIVLIVAARRRLRR